MVELSRESQASETFPEELQEEWGIEWKKKLREQKIKNQEAFAGYYPKEKSVIARNCDYLLDKEKINTYEVLSGLMDCTISFSEGSNAIVLKFDADQLKGKLLQWAEGKIGEEGEREEISNEILLEEINRFAIYISKKFLVKEGRINDYPVAFTNEDKDNPNVFPRKGAAAMFAPSGYPMQPRRKKILDDTGFSVGLIPFYMADTNQLECNVPGLIMQFIENGFSCEGILDKKSDGTTFVSLTKGGSQLSIYDFFEDLAMETPERKALSVYEGIKNEEDLRAKQLALREELFPNDDARNVFKTFFDKAVNPGFRSVMRYFGGERHPDITTEQLIDVAQKIRTKYKDQDYITSEFTLEAPHVETVNKQGSEILENNKKVIPLLAKKVNEVLSPDIKDILGQPAMEFIISAILEYHHDFTDHEVDKQLGILSSATIKFIARSVQYASLFLIQSGVRDLHLDQFQVGKDLISLTDLPEGRNLKFERVFLNDPQVVRLMGALDNEQKQAVYDAILVEMLQYNILRGVKDQEGKSHEYSRIPNTYYVFQEMVSADSHEEAEGHEIVSMTLETLYKPENIHLLDEYPELHEVIIDSYLIYFNQFYETKEVLDRSSSKRGASFFFAGNYGKTPNIVVTLNKTTRKVDFKQVDLRDPFVDYDPELHKKSFGLVKHGFHTLLEAILSESTLQLIGESAEKLLAHRGEELKEKFVNPEDKYRKKAHDTIMHWYEDRKIALSKTADHVKHDVNEIKKDIKWFVIGLIQK